MLSKEFYNSARRTLFAGTMTQAQVTGLDLIYAEGYKRKLPLEQIAYVMATPHHETAMRFEAIEEYGKGHGHFYGDTAGAISNHTASTYEPYAHLYYYGRGWPQLTWLDKYILFGKRLGIPLAETPSMMLDISVSNRVLMDGMQYGLFTGRKLSDYINGSLIDYKRSRAIVNGDVAKNGDMIAGYATHYMAALREDYLAKAATPMAFAPSIPKVVLTVAGSTPAPSLGSRLADFWHRIT